MASEDKAGVVIYLGTLSKVLAPGLRLGYIVAPRPLLDCLAAHRSYLDMHGDQVLETAVSEMIEDGELSRHCNRVRRLYVQRRDALAERLVAELGSVLRFSLPRGGMSIWAEVDRCVNVETWAQKSLSAGANFFTGRRYTFDREPIPYIRLNFAHLTEDELAEGVRRISAALPGAYVDHFRHEAANRNRSRRTVG
jgi:GntR family transcriptional regulator/MocR family aminotransferase